MTLGALIRTTRQELGISQERLARDVNRNQRDISHIETGKLESADLVADIAVALKDRVLQATAFGWPAMKMVNRYAI